MSDAKTILTMIEAVDPSNTEKLNEIDARTDWFLNPDKKYSLRQINGEWRAVNKMAFGIRLRGPHYTHSRDALKSIRPAGWLMTEIHDYGPNDFNISGWTVSLYKIGVFNLQVNTEGLLPTEELAELHAIIQAIEHDRTNQAHIGG